jgi:hypothetical protein
MNHRRMRPIAAVAVAAWLAVPAFAQAPAKPGAGAPTAPRGDALAPGSGAGRLGAAMPAIGGVTPNRAELAGSAFTKLDAGNRGYLTLEDVRQLDGFDSAFRQADRNRDGRLDATEFNAAWGAYTGNVR